jgi:hypothetical protein
MNLKINPSDLQDARCELCSCTTFHTVFKIKKLSALLSPDGKPGYMPVQLFACLSCNHINREFLPEGYDDNDDDDEEQSQVTP